MSDDDSFEERIKALAREVSRSVERMSELDIGHVADAIGIDAERAREIADSAARWIADRAEELGEDAPKWGAFFGHAAGQTAGTSAPVPGPHPLDMPTPEQGRALSALDSGRWTVEPGSNVLHGHGEGPPPGEGLGLVGELRARDWITSDGQVTLVGHNALSRWIESTHSG